MQKRAAHAISNPTLANIEKRWEGMPPQEQADLWMQLRDRMKSNWAELTVQEKKAGLFPFVPPIKSPFPILSDSKFPSRIQADKRFSKQHTTSPSAPTAHALSTPRERDGKSRAIL